MKILGSTWFTQMGGTIIGIVLIDDGFETKAYIGAGVGRDKAEDERYIAETGASFPTLYAEGLVKRYG